MYTKKSQRETQRVEKEWVEAPFMLGQILRVCLLKSMVCICIRKCIEPDIYS